MIRGRDRVPVTSAEQETLAVWAAKTAMMLDRASSTPVIPTGYFHQVRQRKAALSCQRVWIGAYLSSGENLAAWSDHVPWHVGIAATEPPNAHVTTFSVGHVVFQVLGHFTRGEVRVDDQRDFKDGLAEIWPAGDGSLEWPPNHLAFGDRTLRELAASLGA